MRNLAYFIVSLSIIAVSCTPAPHTRTKIGGACACPDQVPCDCETGAFCQHMICTKGCSQEGGDLHPADGTAGGCPTGFDCGIAVAGDTMPSCYAVAYDTAMHGFFQNCAPFAKGCGMAQSPCAAGFDCRAALPCDPEAYCTKACKTDVDCPPMMFCGTEKDGTHLCVTRADCSDCVIDDQCPANFRCGTDAKGGHHCLKTCAGVNTSTDCPQPMNGTSPFELCVNDRGGKGKLCQPANGFCVGPSAVPSLKGDGQVCSGCRPAVPTDCAMGEFCYQDAFSTERFCTQRCTVTFNAQLRPSQDTCPTGSFCYSGQVAPGNHSGVCTADPSYASLTCYP